MASSTAPQTPPDGPTTVAGVDEASVATQLRREALAPHYEAFISWAREEVDPEEVPHFVTIDAHAVELGSWERAALREALDPQSGVEGRVPCSLVEGVAIQVKHFELIGRFEHGPMPPPAELPEFLESLVAVVAVGIALAQDLQEEMNRLIGRGRLAGAKSLAAFRGKILRGGSDVKERIGTREQEEAERRAESLLTVHPMSGSPAPALRLRLREEEPDSPNWATYGGREEAAETPPSRSRESVGTGTDSSVKASKPLCLLKPLLLVLVALLVVYGIVMLSRIRSGGPPVLTLEQFSHLEGVKLTTARPPSLYVVLSGQHWQALTAAERRMLLREMGQIAEEAGYTGIHARTSDGEPVGEWMKNNGVRLISLPSGGT
jgi:hypothetical protein